MTGVEIAWVAGIFEGEGTIGFSNASSVQVQVRMSDEDIVRRLKDVTGLGHVTGPYGGIGRNKPLWCWHVGAKRDVARLLLAVCPLLGARRRERVAEATERLGRGLWRTR